MARGQYRIPEYKPFFGQMMRGIKETTMGVQDRERTERIQREKNEIAQKAWMGDPSAMQALQRADPDLAMKVEDQRHQREAQERQKQLATRQAAEEQRKVAQETSRIAKEGRDIATAEATAATEEEERFKADVGQVEQELAQFPNFPAAQAYGQQQTDILSKQYPELWAAQDMPLEFDEESFNNIKTAQGPQELPEARKTMLVEEVDEEGKGKQTLVYEDDGSPVLDKATGQPVTFGVKPIPKKEPSGDEKDSAGFLTRMYSAQITLDNIKLRYPDFDPASAWQIAKGKSYATMTDEFRLYKQAAMDWVRAKLRDESGAVIGDIEAEDEYDTYFPEPMDPPEVLAQKAQARKTAEDAMLMSASRAWSDPEPGKKMYNPVDVSTLTEAPPKGTWVRLPSGLVKQVGAE